MKLSQLFSIYPHLRWGDSATSDVAGLFSDSRQVEKGAVFVAVVGATVDSHKFVGEACAKGAIAVVVEDTSVVPDNYNGAVLQVESTRLALNRLASRFYGEPASKMFCVGITGTNGKSTITFMVEAILCGFGWQTGVIGTIDHHLGERKWKTDLTTPDALTFHKRLSEFSALGAQACCIEVSSIALDQDRIGSLPFDVAVFTNLTRDHLDYHGDMDTYFECKQKLFTDILSCSNKSVRFAIVNADDPYGKKLRVSEQARNWSYGRSDCDICFQIVGQSFYQTQVKITTPRGEGDLNLPMPGRHNVYNGIAAIGVGLAAGVSLEKCIAALEGLSGVPGRLEPIHNDLGLHIFVDFAHTDDALANVLQVLRSVRESSGGGGRIITVFGCGGDRDTGKRALMGKAAWELSDLVFVTSDNPRTEEPKKITSQILEGMPVEGLGQKVFVELDRRLAIERSLRMANKDDVILIAGKGHEDYQIIGTERREFSDVKVVKEALSCLKIS